MRSDCSFHEASYSSALSMDGPGRPSRGGQRAFLSELLRSQEYHGVYRQPSSLGLPLRRNRHSRRRTTSPFPYTSLIGLAVDWQFWHQASIGFSASELGRSARFNGSPPNLSSHLTVVLSRPLSRIALATSV